LVSSRTLDAVNFSGLSAMPLPLTISAQSPAKLTYTTSDSTPAKLKLWTKRRQLRALEKQLCNPGSAGRQRRSGNRHRITGGKLTYGGAELSPMATTAGVLGPPGLFFDAWWQPLGTQAQFRRVLFQGTYTFIQKLTFAPARSQPFGTRSRRSESGFVLSNNSSEIGGVRYKLTNWVNLVGEYTHHTVKCGMVTGCYLGCELAAGSILFF